MVKEIEWFRCVIWRVVFDALILSCNNLLQVTYFIKSFQVSEDHKNKTLGSRLWDVHIYLNFILKYYNLVAKFLIGSYSEEN